MQTVYTVLLGLLFLSVFNFKKKKKNDCTVPVAGIVCPFLSKHFPLF